MGISMYSNTIGTVMKDTKMMWFRTLLSEIGWNCPLMGCNVVIEMKIGSSSHDSCKFVIAIWWVFVETGGVLWLFSLCCLSIFLSVVPITSLIQGLSDTGAFILPRSMLTEMKVKYNICSGKREKNVRIDHSQSIIDGEGIAHQYLA